ncbi:MAG: DUF4065 domain-containing protein [Thermoplasmata archaeon]|nr:DUF4065 domain-containing protein [Thermoplasmata archaeon]
MNGTPPYNATDVARFIIRKYADDGNPVTNMKLQKMLYYAWVEFHRTRGLYLFEDAICACRFGPVVPQVYREYRIYAGMPILHCDPPGDIDPDTAMFLADFADAHSGFTASDLPNLTRRDGYPWKSLYREGEKFTEIPFWKIIRIEHRLSATA